MNQYDENIEFTEEEEKELAKKEFGERLKEVIKNKSYTYDKLANESGVSKSYISKLCNGHNFPSVDKLYELSKALDIDIKILVNGFEEWIPLKNFQSDDGSIDIQRYYDILKKQISLIEHTQGKFKEKIDEWLIPSSRKESSETTFTVPDTSMHLIGIYKGSRVSYFGIETKMSEIDYSKVYIIKFQDKRRPIVRKLFAFNDKVLAIPYSDKLSFKPIILTTDDYKIYEVISVTNEY